MDRRDFLKTSYAGVAMACDAPKYKDIFSIRNLCANGVAWDGKNGARDYIASHEKAPGAETYKIYLVDARDESMRVMGCLNCNS
jgi:hypothetical protein